jgi:hypothetical protein
MLIPSASLIEAVAAAAAAVVGAPPRNEAGSAPASSTSYDASVVKSCQSHLRESNSVDVHIVGALMWSTEAAIWTPRKETSALSSARTLGERMAGESMLCTTRTSRRRRRGFCTDDDDIDDDDDDEGDVDAGEGGSAVKNCATSSTLCGAPGKRASAAKTSRAEKDGRKPLRTRTCAWYEYEYARAGVVCPAHARARSLSARRLEPNP